MKMKVRFALAICASAAALAAVPAAASAAHCLSPHVKAFHGHARLSFQAQASGPDEPGQPQYGSETVGLKRDASSLDIHLTHKKVTRSGIVIFTGKASGGSVTVKDTFDDSRGNSSSHGEETYNGILSNQLPNLGSATLFLDPSKCQYQFQVGFNVKTTFSGDQGVNNGVNGASGGANSGHEKIPGNLHLVGGDGPDAYHGCPDSVFTGTACYDFGGGYSVDFMTLFDCHSAQAVNCSSGNKPVGTAQLIWILFPTYVKPPKKKK